MLIAFAALVLVAASGLLARSDDLMPSPPGQEATADDEPDRGPKPGEGDETDPAAPKPRTLEVQWDGGLHLSGKWDYLHVKLGGDLQNDTAGYVNTESAEDPLGTEIDNGVQWRRARLYAKGRLHRHLDFKFQYDFTAGNPPSMKDAYLKFVDGPIPTVELGVGRFRTPLGLDGFTGPDDNVFMERSLLSTTFLPSRNTGIVLYGDSPRHRVRWSFAVLQPQANQIDLSDTDELGWSGRFAWAFTAGKEKKTLVHLGADFWRRNVADTVRFATRPESHLAPNFVNTGDMPAEHSDVTVLELAVRRGRVAFETEAALARVGGAGQVDRHFQAFYAQASWLLTGEKRPYRTDRATFARPRPRRSVREGGIGALEVAFRFSRIDLDDRGIEGGTLNDWCAAFSWYPTHHLRFMFNGILADLQGAKPVGIFQVRLQVAY